MVKITLPDKSVKEFDTSVTPQQIAESIGAGLAKAALAAKVDGKLVDVSYEIQEDATVSIITYKDPEGVDVFRHSAAHVLAHAIQELYPNAKNTIGPPVEEGFYYDFDDLEISQDDFEKIEAKMKEIINADLPTKREVWTVDKIKEHFKNNPYKAEMAEEYAKEGQELSVYWQGDKFVDLCEGPHVPKTGMIKAIKILKLAGAYWRADSNNKQLTRVYAIAFPTEKELKAHLTLLEEASKRDHRRIGKDLHLFTFHEWSPGSPFFLPKGSIIFNELVGFIRKEYFKRGYEEVKSPQLFNKSLWEASGHWEHFRDDMFTLKVDKEDYALKPMNCPGHTLIFNMRTRSYRDMPVRMAEFSGLHRNELRGVVGGMTRVRRLQQDDAHIFCTEEQIHEEIDGVIKFMKYIYDDVFKFEYHAKLSTRPDKAMGDEELWKRAEATLEQVLSEQEIDFTFDHGGGAFYGPKIDVFMKDAIGRDWQLCTIQLDFQMPRSLNVQFEGEDNQKHYAVMIHRALFGSLERFMGILTEHFAGKFPLWLSPTQAKVLSISDKFNDYAKQVVERMQTAGLRVELDDRNMTLNKKVREAELQRVNYILVVGEKEMNDKTVNVRTRDNKVLGAKNTDTFIFDMKSEIDEKRL